MFLQSLQQPTTLTRPMILAGLILLAAPVAYGQGGACPGLTLPCNVAGGDSFNNPLATQQLDTYDCAGSQSFPGKELVYGFTAPTTGDVTVELTDLSADFDLFVLSNGGGCDGANCLDASGNFGTDDEEVTFHATAGETYYFSVEDFDQGGGTFTFSVTCEGGDDVCMPDDTTLCLPGDNRFEVELYFYTDQGAGNEGPAKAIPLDSLGLSAGGMFYFVNPTDPQFLVKVVNGCPVNNRFWVFYAATTNVGFTLIVTDTQSGEMRQYDNPDRNAAPPVQDTQAFATCPAP